MLASTVHWKPIVNGYSGFEPQSYAETAERMRPFPDASRSRGSKTLGVTHVVIHRERLGATRDSLPARMEASGRFHLVTADPLVRLYELGGSDERVPGFNRFKRFRGFRRFRGSRFLQATSCRDSLRQWDSGCHSASYRRWTRNGCRSHWRSRRRVGAAASAWWSWGCWLRRVWTGNARAFSISVPSRACRGCLDRIAAFLIWQGPIVWALWAGILLVVVWPWLERVGSSRAGVDALRAAPPRDRDRSGDLSGCGVADGARCCRAVTSRTI